MRALGPLVDADQEKFVNAAIAAIQRNRDPQALLALSTGLAAIPVTLTDVGPAGRWSQYSADKRAIGLTIAS